MTLHAKIKAASRRSMRQGKPVAKTIDTTPGRLMLAETAAEIPKMPFDLVNRLLTKKEIGNLIDKVYRHCGQKETVHLLPTASWSWASSEACKAGISFGKADMVVPDGEGKLVERHRKRARGVRKAIRRRPDHPGREVQ